MKADIKKAQKRLLKLREEYRKCKLVHISKVIPKVLEIAKNTIKEV